MPTDQESPPCGCPDLPSFAAEVGVPFLLSISPSFAICRPLSLVLHPLPHQSMRRRSLPAKPWSCPRSPSSILGSGARFSKLLLLERARFYLLGSGVR